jgi:hypothetical protein
MKMVTKMVVGMKVEVRVDYMMYFQPNPIVQV